MVNLLIYSFIHTGKYELTRLVNGYLDSRQDDSQGIVFREYNNEFVKATYWQRKKRKQYKYNIESKCYEQREEEIVNVVEFCIEEHERKLFVFGSRQMAQRIITLIGIISENAYSITDSVFNMKKIVKKISYNKGVQLLKAKLEDIIIEKGVVVDCNVNLLSQDNPVDIVRKYIENIIVISFRFEKLDVNISIHKTGKISLNKINEDDTDELIQKVIDLIC